MALPTIGHGSVFNMIVGSTTTPLAGVKSIAFGSDKVDALDTTNMSSAGITRTFIGGLHNPGDVTVKFNYEPTDASQATLYGLEDGQVHNFSVVYPGSIATESFSGIIVSLTKDVNDDKLAERTLKIQIAGSFTLV